MANNRRVTPRWTILRVCVWCVFLSIFRKSIEKAVVMAVVAESALENAASIAAMILTTESIVSEKEEPQPAVNPGAGMDGMY